MNTITASTRKGPLTKTTAVVAAALMAGGIALGVAVPAHAGTVHQTAAASATVNQTLLREGSRGAAVADWQSTLNQLAAKSMPSQPKVAVDGIFGPKTKAATVAFQRWAGIIIDGIVGPQTRGVAATALSSAALDPNPHLKPVLREGSQGVAVKAWQTTLNKLTAAGKPGQPTVAVDGIFGPKTKAATVTFQRWAHITVDGIVGVQTYTAAAQAVG